MEDTVLRVKRILSELLGVPSEAISDETSMQNVRSWDSLKPMNLVATLDEELKP